jgi:hypothetical protein
MNIHEIQLMGDATNGKAVFDSNEYLENITFGIKGEQFYLSQKLLSQNAKAQLAALANFLGGLIPWLPQEEADAVLYMSDQYMLHVAKDGEYIRFSVHGHESLYWDHQEFEEDSTVLGALAGAMITNCHSYRVTAASNKLGARHGSI